MSGSLLSRRAVFAGAAAAVLPAAAQTTPAPPAAPREWQTAVAQTAIPRWRGFNLLDLFQALSREDRRTAPVTEDECRWIRDWGFNFIRIPMDYWHWVDSDWPSTRTLTPDDVLHIRDSAIDPVDRIVDLGRKFGLHVSLNFHRAPGFCVNNPEREPYVLWSDSRAEDAFVYHWEYFARRYRGVSEFDLSFNLLNEAPRPRAGYMDREDYIRVMRMAAEHIRQVSPRRLIIIDGLETGNAVVEEMIGTGVAQSVHAYWPGAISHYRAAWVDKESKFPPPAWPIVKEDGTESAGRRTLEERYAKWAELARKGVGVHCGECGCFNRTPHNVFLSWFSDVLDILGDHGIGWALWNLRGGFGILDSGREDVDYEDWYGHKLDRKLLTLLQRS